jgi:hypothetical protein
MIIVTIIINVKHIIIWSMSSSSPIITINPPHASCMTSARSTLPHVVAPCAAAHGACVDHPLIKSEVLIVYATWSSSTRCNRIIINATTNAIHQVVRSHRHQARMCTACDGCAIAESSRLEDGGAVLWWRVTVTLA